jgi:hypothetical protein
MAMITLTDNTGSPSVKITYVEPANNGSPVLAYEIKIKAANGTFYTTSECNGTTTSCDVNMTTLRAEPFNLVRGNNIRAVVKSNNSVGWATQYSPENTGNVVLV